MPALAPTSRAQPASASEGRPPPAGHRVTRWRPVRSAAPRPAVASRRAAGTHRSVAPRSSAAGRRRSRPRWRRRRPAAVRRWSPAPASRRPWRWPPPARGGTPRAGSVGHSAAATSPGSLEPRRADPAGVRRARTASADVEHPTPHPPAWTPPPNLRRPACSRSGRPARLQPCRPACLRPCPPARLRLCRRVGWLPRPGVSRRPWCSGRPRRRCSVECRCRTCRVRPVVEPWARRRQLRHRRQRWVARVPRSPARWSARWSARWRVARAGEVAAACGSAGPLRRRIRRAAWPAGGGVGDALVAVCHPSSITHVPVDVRSGRTLMSCPGTSSVAAPAATPSRSTARWPRPVSRRPALRGTPTRSSCSPPSPSPAVVRVLPVPRRRRPVVVAAVAAADVSPLPYGFLQRQLLIRMMTVLPGRPV